MRAFLLLFLFFSSIACGNEEADFVGHPRQLTPTAIYEIRAVIGEKRAPLLRVISLDKGIIMPPALEPGIVMPPAIEWQPYHEHIFVPAQVDDLAKRLDGAKSLEIVLVYRSEGGVDEKVQAYADKLLASGARFQAYGLARLEKEDWQPGPPQAGPLAFHFVDKDRGIGAMVDVNPAKPGELAQIAWLTEDPSISDFFAKAGSGDKLLLQRTEPENLPADGYHYTSKHE
jgi:hypothetical protein